MNHKPTPLPWRKLLFLIICYGLPSSMHSEVCRSVSLSSLSSVSYILAPWAVQLVILLAVEIPMHTVLGQPRLGRVRAKILALAAHVTGIALLIRFHPQAAWACSMHALLHATPIYALPITLATCAIGCAMHTDTEIMHALLWPELMESVVVRWLP
jgi:hypothetical protein